MDGGYGHLKIPVLGISLEQLILILYPSFLVPAVYLWYGHLQRRRTEASQPYGCTRLGLRGPSHMTDEYDSKYDSGTDDQSQWKIKAIHIHPIKSCAPVEVDEAEMEGSGLTWDRKFVFAELLPEKPTQGGVSSEQLHKWTFRTLRTPGFEKLALVKPEVWVPEETNKDFKLSRRIERTGALVIHFPNIPTGPLAFLDRFFMQLGFLPKQLSFQVPLTPTPDNKYPRELVQIWSEHPTWLNMGLHIPDTFKAYINAKNPLTLFRVDPDPASFRKVFRDAPPKQELGYEPTIGANDSFPLHIMNLASVHDVGNRVKDSITNLSARRYRDNVLIIGPPAYDEDRWKKIVITGDDDDDGQRRSHTFYCGRYTTRCRLPNVDPDTSERHPVEPDKTMRSFRCIDENHPKHACLGLQLVAANMEALGGKVKIRVGNTISVDNQGVNLAS